ncbi:MAG TPA: glycosyltransferase, partial [Elusimicrobiales bacterium]|nr:glycosyltransferase [Elusimicrobiales bacterium]
MRILIASGGTGGHFYPGYSAAQELKKSGAEILFVLRSGDPAGRVLQEECLPFAGVDLVGFPRSLNPLAHLRFAWKLLSALLAARRVIKDWRPDAVLGTGGYISFPAVFWAATGGIPAIVHESNAKPGLANYILSLMGTHVAAGLPVNGFPKKTSVTMTGTPIRAFFAVKTDKTAARKELGLEPDKATVLAFGGSGGAIGLNLALAEGYAAGRRGRP